MKILLDENLPRKLVLVLRAEGHDVESVHTLQMQGLANGKLYEFAKESYDLSKPAGRDYRCRAAVAGDPLGFEKNPKYKQSRKKMKCGMERARLISGVNTMFVPKSGTDTFAK